MVYNDNPAGDFDYVVKRLGIIVGIMALMGYGSQIFNPNYSDILIEKARNVLEMKTENMNYKNRGLIEKIQIKK